ncbi:MAG: glutathione peroxidase [Spirochaetota bacterium]
MAPIYDSTVQDIDGKDLPLRSFSGKVLMVVNVASKCGFTPQYEGLERLYRKYKDRGFVILGFPANDFMWQEPGNEGDIKQFCKMKYDVTFPLASKISVKGKDMHPVYKLLTSKETNPKTAGEIGWNFTKFIIARDGSVAARFESAVVPESPDIVNVIESLIAKK